MVDRDLLSSRLDALEGFLAELRTFREVTREDFVREPGLHHLAERFLHLACESVLDTAHHVIADQGWRQPTTYRDAMNVLKEQGILDSNLCERLKTWMGFRNVLVHLYLEIDHGRCFDAIKYDLEDLKQFACSLAPLLAEGEK